MPTHRKRRLKAFIAKWDVPFAILTVLLYAVVLAAVLVKSPQLSTTDIGVIMLFSGLTASLSALGAAIKSSDDTK